MANSAAVATRLGCALYNSLYAAFITASATLDAPRMRSIYSDSFTMCSSDRMWKQSLGPTFSGLAWG